MHWLRNWLAEDYHYTLADKDVSNEITTLIFTFIVGNISIFFLEFEPALIISIGVYVFLRYMQRGYDDRKRF